MSRRGWVELCEAAAPARQARLKKSWGANLGVFKEVAEPFEDSPVAEAVTVFDQARVVAMLTAEVLSEDIGDGADASSEARVVEHVNHRTRRVRHCHLIAATPDRDRAEQGVLITDSEVEGNALNDLVAVADAPSGDHEQSAKCLLSEGPVTTGTPSSDVARAEEPSCYDPWILNPRARLAGIKGNSHVQPTPHAGQPPTPGQVAEELACFLVRDAEDPGGFAHVKSSLSAAVQLLQKGTISLGDPSTKLWMRSKLHLGKYTALLI